MLQRTLLFSAIGCALLSILFVSGFLFVRSVDLDAYYLLETKKKELSRSTALMTTQQNRKGVLKEIYLTQDTQRLHYKIASQNSFLTLVPRQGKFDLYEKLETIDCWLQDKLYYDGAGLKAMQQIKHLTAKEGTYRYNSQEFIAGSVDLALYRASGHELTEIKTNPFMQGVADSVSFAVTGKNPEFHAQRFRAILQGTQGEAK